MKYLTLVITFVVCFSWVTVEYIQQDRVYRSEHDRLMQEFLMEGLKYRIHPMPDASKIPGGVEINPGEKRI